MNQFALVDCNNFFASCERVFRPDLIGKPVAILSNNDGCIISRSEEVKALQIPMGAPIFKWKDMLKKHQVQLFSANFPLYGDISHRIMQTLGGFTPEIEVYSIDEAFLNLDGINPQKLTAVGVAIRHRVQQWVNIPVSVGIASTKTLAKLANFLCKKHNEFQGVMNLTTVSDIDNLLARVDVADIWGIGRKLAKFFYSQQIMTALQLKNSNDLWVRKKLGLLGQRMVWELRGISCLAVDSVEETKKSIISSRSFGIPITHLAQMKEAIATYTCRAAEKLRQESACAQALSVWITTNRFKPEEKQYSNSCFVGLPESTAYTPTLIDYAHQCLVKIFLPGYKYKKAGITLSGIRPANQQQSDLFHLHHDTAKESRVSQLVDQLNHKYGAGTVKYLAEGLIKPWYMKSMQRSPAYTTCWGALPTL